MNKKQQISTPAHPHTRRPEIKLGRIDGANVRGPNGRCDAAALRSLPPREEQQTATEGGLVFEAAKCPYRSQRPISTPGSGIVGNRGLVHVAVVRDPRQAIPLHGTWTGFPSDNLGMTVEVNVTARRGGC
jgi:hypothetical protein